MTLLYSLDLIGTAAFAASGAWAGIRRDMDLFGVAVLGLVTATGGGTLRDVLLGTPPFCLQNETYLYLSLAVALAVFCFHRRLAFLQHPLLYFDAVGLGTFVVIGSGKALGLGSGWLGTVLMGVMTATAGGVLRDVLSGTGAADPAPRGLRLGLPGRRRTAGPAAPDTACRRGWRPCWRRC